MPAGIRVIATRCNPGDPGLQPPIAAIRDVVGRALAEDLLPLGDLTADLIPAGVRATAAFVARKAGVIAGSGCVAETYRQLGDHDVAVQWCEPDGSAVAAGAVLGTVTGPLAPILTGERTALNLLCHLSGIATLTHEFVERAAAVNPGCRIRDTRKTTPGLRALEKAAVRAGGGANHRGNLSDGILVKDNHLGGMTIAVAVATARRRWPGRVVQVECDTLEQVDEALACGADILLVDNMTPDEVRGAVSAAQAAVSRAPGVAGAGGGAGAGALARVPIEVSGGVDLTTVEAYAATGAEFISVGALTHSAPVLDIGLDIDLNRTVIGLVRAVLPEEG